MKDNKDVFIKNHCDLDTSIVVQVIASLLEASPEVIHEGTTLSIEDKTYSIKREVGVLLDCYSITEDEKDFDLSGLAG